MTKKLLILGLLSVNLLFGSIFFLANSVASANTNTAASKLAPVSNFAADTADRCDTGFFGLKPWYYYMSEELYSSGENKCSVKCFNLFPKTVPNDCGQTRSDIPGILLAIVDDLLRIAGLVAIVFIIVASFQFIISRGNADQTAQARNTLINAAAGLGVAAVAVAFVAFVGRNL